MSQTFISNNLSGSTISGNTYYSGGTPLETIISSLAVAGSSTLVQPGLNIYTGGTSSSPTINISAATLSYLSAQTITANTLTFNGNPDSEILFKGNQTANISHEYPNQVITYGTNGGGHSFTTNNYSSYLFNLVGTTAQVNGDLLAYSVSASTISGGTLYSGSTELGAVIDRFSTRVQPGTNITTGGTSSAPIVSVVASPVFTNLTATTITATTLNSDTVNANDGSFGNTLNAGVISASFLNASGGGFSIESGGIASSTLTGGTVSGGTFYSGSTPLSTIISNLAGGGSSVLALSAGTNITTGGTQQNPTVNVTPNPTFSTLIATSTINSNLIQAGQLMTTPLLTATTVSGGTYFSGGTPLETIISSLAVAGSTTLVQPGLFITTGGTSSQPTINLAQNISGATVSAGTIYSGSTNLSSYFPKTNSNSQTYGPITAGATLRTLFSGSVISFPAGSLKVGSRIQFSMQMSKTNAGTASNAYGIHISNSSSPTSASTMIMCFSGITQTAAADQGIIEADIYVKSTGASAVMQGWWRLSKRGTTVGFANVQSVVSGITSATFDSTTAQSFGFSFSGGASSVVTIPFIYVNTTNI